MRELIVRVFKCFTVLAGTLMHKLFGAKDSKPRILMYHRVCLAPSGVSSPTWNVTMEAFRSHIKGIIEAGYSILSLRDFIIRAAENKSCEKCTVITFDDGYGNFYKDVYPVLKEYGVPASIFLATAYIDSDKPFPWDRWSVTNAGSTPEECWMPLTWQQCAEMKESGLVDIGSHTHRHENWHGNIEFFNNDMRKSLDVLKSRLNGEEFTFAFPFGRKAMGLAGEGMLSGDVKGRLLCALTTEIEPATSDNPYDWGRYEVNEFDTPSSVVAKLAGWYDWVDFCRKTFSGLSRRSIGRIDGR